MTHRTEWLCLSINTFTLFGIFSVEIFHIFHILKADGAVGYVPMLRIPQCCSPLAGELSPNLLVKKNSFLYLQHIAVKIAQKPREALWTFGLCLSGFSVWMTRVSVWCVHFCVNIITPCSERTDLATKVTIDTIKNTMTILKDTWEFSQINKLHFIYKGLDYILIL